MKSFTLLLVLLFTFKSIAQNSVSSDSINNNNETTLLEFLFIPSAKSPASLFSFSDQYLYTHAELGFRTSGFSPTLGINIARFFSSNFILGVCVESKLLPSFTQQHFSKEFVNDFNANFKESYTSEIDSLHGNALKGGINNQKDPYYFRGNWNGNLGVIFSPFPNKYGGFKLQLKYGGRNYFINGLNTNAVLKNRIADKSDSEPLGVFTAQSIELSCKPYTFFKESYLKLNANKGEATRKHTFIENMYKTITISFYYEQIQLKKVEFFGKPFDFYVNQNFINKYAVMRNFGFKIGFSI
jgi:hypothetical protein